MIREDMRQLQRTDPWPGNPWAFMSRPNMDGASIRAIEYVLARFERDHDDFHILEWGHGGSTYYLSRFLDYSMKQWSWTGLDWMEGRANAIVANQHMDSRVGLIWEEDYVGFPAKLGKRYDLVLITGRHRRECLHELINITAEGTTVLVYDPERQLHEEASRICAGQYILGSSVWRGRYGA